MLKGQISTKLRLLKFTSGYTGYDSLLELGKEKFYFQYRSGLLMATPTWLKGDSEYYVDKFWQLFTQSFKHSLERKLAESLDAVYVAYCWDG